MTIRPDFSRWLPWAGGQGGRVDTVYQMEAVECGAAALAMVLHYHGHWAPLEEVRDAVLRDWKVAKALEIRELHYARLRERYVVEIRGAEDGTKENK